MLTTVSLIPLLALIRGRQTGAYTLPSRLPRGRSRFWLEFSLRYPLGWEVRKAMKASKFSVVQKAFILKQGNDGVPIADICRKAGISQATYFNRKKRSEGLLPTEMRWLKQLEDEDSKPKKLLADFRSIRKGCWT